MKIQPLRNMVLLELAPNGAPSKRLTVIAPEQAICRFVVRACGPEIRDVAVGQVVLANRLAATTIQGQFLLPESAILGIV